MPTLTSKLGALQRGGMQSLKEASIDTAALDARLLLCHATGMSHEQLVANSDDVIEPETQSRFLELIERRRQGEPVGRIMGCREFWGLEFDLGPETLEPRADSEAIVEATLSWIENRNASLRILDLGTGSGCLLLSLLAECPNARGLGIDVSAPALSVARSNAGRLGLADRAEFQKGIWADGLEGTFDIIISNPPYIPTLEVQSLSREVRDHDPARALDGGTDGMECYREIVQQLPERLCQGGIAALETSPDLYTELRELVENVGQFRMIEGIKDMAGRDRGLRFRKDKT